MKNTILRIAALALLACVTVVMTACNTTKGLGEDVDALGENMSDSARDNGARP